MELMGEVLCDALLCCIAAGCSPAMGEGRKNKINFLIPHGDDDDFNFCSGPVY
jgi:hypothetical protein